MARSGLLLPSEPLFIVDKTWRHQGSSKRSIKIEVNPFSEDILKVHKADRSRAQGASQFILHEPADGRPDVANGKGRYQFIAADEPGGRQDDEARTTVRKQARKHAENTRKKKLNIKQGDVLNKDSPEKARNLDNNVREIVVESNSSTKMPAHAPLRSLTVYVNTNESARTGLECYLYYYHDIVAEIANPLRVHATLESNPLRAVCIPLALNDRFLLRTIMLASAIHCSYLNVSTEPEFVNSLARRVLSELRNRIARKDMSDATLLSVGLIAILENLLGHHDQWHVHATGLRKMLDLRGGPHMIDASIRWTLYRAMLIGAIETDLKPLMPRPPTIEHSQQDSVPSTDMTKSSLQVSLTSSRVGMSMRAILLHIEQFLHMTKKSVDGRADFGIYFHHHSCLQIQHDLLQLQTSSALDEAWRVPSLAFVETFMRGRACGTAKNTVVSGKLRLALARVSSDLADESHYIWMVFMGTLLSSANGDHTWFLERMAELVSSHGWVKWEDMKRILEKVLWLDILHDKICASMWQEVLPLVPHLSSNDEGTTEDSNISC